MEIPVKASFIGLRPMAQAAEQARAVARGCVVFTLLLLTACQQSSPLLPTAQFDHDVLIFGGTVVDGSGAPGERMDIAVRGDRIVAIGDLAGQSAATVIDARAKIVSPGFINMLSWGVRSLMHDGRGLSDIVQGVTLEVFGEGWSMGPIPAGGLDENTAAQLEMRAGEQPPWRTLGEYMLWLESRGVSPNIASFVGATTLRMHEMGTANRAPTAQELAAMRALTHDAMREGALGLGSSLIYPPAFFASTEELISLAQVVGEYGGMYISHLRSEGTRIEESVAELIRIAREAGVPAEIHHLKLAGQENWGKFDRVVAMIEAARAEGLAISANMYTYPAGATGLNATLPPWTGEGGLSRTVARIREPATRALILADMRSASGDWEQMLRAAGPAGVLVTGFANPELQAAYAGKTLAEIAALRGQSAEEAAIDLVAEDETRVEAIYFMMSEQNLARKIALPWMSFGSDARTYSASDDEREQAVHPRAYGNFARVLAKYTRDEGVLVMEDAVRKLTGLPAQNLQLKDRGLLRPGFFADIVVFDPATIADHASFAQPHQLATGVEHVLVNGKLVLRDGTHTGAMPGRFVRGPAYRGAAE